MEMSAGSSKKRKVICQEDDEAQMETFFALVRNIRETRERWMGLKSGERRSKRGEIIRGRKKIVGLGFGSQRFSLRISLMRKLGNETQLQTLVLLRGKTVKRKKLQKRVLI
ncbi:hypothetical protein ACSQ67_015324 [Phaseolus vulgaris]